MCDFGTGNNNKMNFVERNRQDVVNILEAVYRGATKGKGQVNSPKGKFEFLFLLNSFKRGFRYFMSPWVNANVLL